MRTYILGDCRENPVEQHGCPTLEELRRCDPSIKVRQCETTTPTCSGQYNDQVNIFEHCDITDNHQRTVLRKIAEHTDDSICMTKVLITS